MDIVFIEQLSVITTIGVYDWEQDIEQKSGWLSRAQSLAHAKWG